MDTSNDYYAVLGVDPQASASVIKTAFKKLAFQYHPDLNAGADTQERMREILRAYQTLSDPQARREYDIQRRGEGGSARVGTMGGATPRQGNGAVSDGKGRFAFPDLRETPISVLSFALEGITYRLSSAQAESLKWDGMLRGAALVADADAFYHCHRCHHRWSARGNALPATCPNCHARDWAEYLLLRCTHCQAVFASQEMRDPLHGDSLYHPYELFPPCPHCRRSQWCPAENGRVQSLRAAAARRAMMLWGSVAVVCILLVAILALVVLH
jgi:hypothetical protein